MEKQTRDKCRQAPGVVRPMVDPTRCEGKAACVDVCPVDVFEIVRIPADTFKALPLVAKFKVWAHGMKTAATPNAFACEGCGLCVSACPERAIRLQRFVA
ncbi:4Fe-4S binding protein [Mesorhizobium sp.]|uniref:4Fe-4S binding protein n=1 Tax=Mesorhizobium sp. TaxID=1871066 RepID=UPI000FE74333|nr:4Fe-4S binding protein [Mesorhizobium sp.]RWA72296.1 MAG: 4Fe-4S ferredoxin [Mesorhizobium sp.]RWA80199.1 MAG: 4Fe-4S ferredoxin [Mesorhizobium sp.]